MNKPFIGLIFAVATAGGAAEFDRVWRDPELELRIRVGTEINRKGFATLRFTDTKGKPVTNVDLDFKQVLGSLPLLVWGDFVKCHVQPGSTESVSGCERQGG